LNAELAAWVAELKRSNKELLAFDHMKTVDLTMIARVITANLRLTDSGRQVAFRIAEGLTANGDSELLQVVLENLLGNAWKYTGRQGETVIEFDSTKIDEAKTFFVKDNGPGFSMADAEGLFVPFKRLPGTAEFTGHGIGLATVAKIIRRHGGKVWADGEPGKGATFYFTLQT
jgi:signal transduction histidine kinase